MSNHLSYQRDRPLLLPATHFAPLLTVSSPFLMPAHMGEQEVILRRFVVLLLYPQYLCDSTQTHKEAFLVLNRQFSLASSAVFLGLAA